MKKLLLDWLEGAASSFDGQIDQVVAVLTGQGRFDIFELFMNHYITGSIKASAYIITAICLMIEMAQVAAKVDIIKWEMALKLGFKLVAAKVCIDMGALFLQALWQQAMEWIAMALPSTSAGAGGIGHDIYLNILAPIVEDAGFIERIGLLIPVLIYTLASYIIGLVIYAIALGRLFEVAVYITFAPIAFAFFPLGGGDGAGFSRITGKFIRSFAAVCLQGVMMIVCLVIFKEISGSLTDAALANQESMFAAMFGVILIQVVLVMAIMKCRTWANSLLDAA